MRILFRLKFTIAVLVFCLLFTKIQSQNIPQIAAVGNQFYCSELPMSIVTNISISNTLGTLDTVFVQISTGYTLGEDILYLEGIHPNINANWSAGEGLLTLEGPASFSEFETAISAIRFQTTQSVFTQDKFFSINLGEANFLPSTGHYYFYVADLSITWLEAKAAAEQRSYFGLQGYLATITSEEEMQLTGEQSSGTGWIGGSDQQNEGVWIWETGPEAGQVFWEGLSNGYAPNDMYAFWNTSEPNNLNNEEDYAHITAPNIGILGSWNDLTLTGGNDPNSDFHPKGYIVEFGGMPGDPDINISASTTIVTPKLEVTTYTVCNSSGSQITLNSNADNAYWYDSLTSTTVVNSGLTNQNLIEGSTTYWVELIFNGCSEGARIPITVNVNASPVANDITIIQCEDDSIDFISTFYLNNYRNDIVRDDNGQIETGLNVRFFEDDLLQNEITSNSYNNSVDFQKIYALVTNESTACLSLAEITLQVNPPNGYSATLEVCDDLEADGFATFNLSEANPQLLNSETINTTVSYYLTFDEALEQANEIVDSFTNVVAFNQVVYARINIDNNCYAINEVVLHVKDLPNVLQYEEIYYCLNSFPETITLSGGIIDDVPNNYYYNWFTGETTMDIEVNEPGTYSVTVTQPLGCSNERTITVLPSSTAEVESIEVTDLSENNTVSVLVNGNGDYRYALNNENGIYQTSNHFENVPAGFHTIFIKDIKADCGTVSSDISILGFPKFFTPNGDAVNETWQITGFSSEFNNTATVEIFNRYGKLITILKANNSQWDGTINGAMAPSDDYWFIARFIDGRTYKGHFTLKR
ncbi:T9SS type B sorting domain-containing protein [Winogradskyella bathintestinalis]|uniref:T9SS type B sorting domain-containing protein n=1 Tax=Winogradskyella bathintestinalis TaxID=3035208 RepID=A0ABT7ZYJ0_9FLAO|nr:T9SS type B sorting domain-containing protein [Winogradskyella bathintestinalis]MDN3494073.1 T9SS type B sorting domain-containing protein [Winogradskyella bathintestinalis]